MNIANGGKTVRMGQFTVTLKGDRRVDTRRIRPMKGLFRISVTIHVDVALVIYGIAAIIAALHT